jgi:hypothetical protein
LPLASNNDWLGLGRRSSQLHDDNNGRGGGNGRHRVHHDTEPAVIGVRLVRVQVRNLSYDEHREQDQTEHRHGRQNAGPSAAFAAGNCLKSCQSIMPSG